MDFRLASQLSPGGRALAIAIGFATAVQGASLLEQRVDEILRTAKALSPAAVGVHVIQLRSGKILYERNSEKLLTPASNTKLFSTALALTRLGAAHRLVSRLYADVEPDAGGRLDGDLRLYGGGDPSMSDVAIPYQKDAPAADPLAAIDSFAEAVLTRGIREVTGDIVGDDSAYRWEPYPPGWSEDDTVWEYGAAVSALTLNRGVVKVSIHPGQADGDPASVSVSPVVEYFAIDNRVKTTGAGAQKIVVNRSPGSRQVQITGTVLARKGGVTEELAVDDPALFTATALYDALTRRGVIVRGKPAVRHRDAGEPARAPAGVLLSERQSPALIELLRVVDKISQNLWAELMLREVGRVRGGDGSRKAGLDELKAFLAEIGVQKDGYVFEDGSGLSRLTLVSPEVITRLLRFMYASPNVEHWKSLLPVGGVDGTLEKRFAGAPGASVIQAKTGSLSHVNTLSGYVESGTYGEVAFSIMVNHSVAPASEVRAAIDRIALALLE